MQSLILKSKHTLSLRVFLVNWDISMEARNTFGNLLLSDYDNVMI